MNSWNWIWRGVLVAAMIIAAIVSVLLFWIDPGTFKNQIVSSVRETTGRELIISGDVHLEFFPYLGVAVEALELGNPTGFDGSFLTLQKAQLKARLLPLLMSRLDVVAVDVEGLVLHLSRDAQGKGNWVDLASAPESGLEGDGGLAKDKRVPLLASLIVDGLHVSDASVIWHDERTGDNVEVSGIEIDVSDFSFGEPFAVDTHAVVASRGLRANVDFAAEAVLELDRLAVEDLTLTARLSGDSLSGSPETINVMADYFSTDGRLDNARMQGLGLDLRAGLREGPNATTSGSLDIATFSPRNVYGRLGLTMPELVDASTLDRVALSCEWTGNRERLDITRLNLVVDNATIQGEVSAVGRTNPSLVFDLRADTLNVDRYRARSAVDGSGGKSSGAAKRELPLRALRALDLNGTLSVDSLIFANLRLADVRIMTRANAGNLSLERIEAETYGGRLDASASMDVRSDTPVYSWSHELSGLQAGPLLRDLHGKELITGTAKSSAVVRAQGLNIAGLKRSLNGNIDFQVLNGAVIGINIAENMRDEIRKLMGQALGLDEPDRTDFSILSGSGVIVDGVVTTRDLLLLAPRFKVTGSGKTDLVRENLDFSLVIALEGSQGKFEDGALGLTSVPVRVSGPVRKPVVSADTAVVLRALGIRGGQAIKDALEGVGSGLNKGAQGLIRLFE